MASRASVAQKLFDARTLVICGEIQSEMARAVVEQLLALSAASNDDITLYLHSPGGHVESGDTIHDMLTFIEPKVNIVGTGWVASAGAHIYLAVPREQRFCLPNTRFLLHQPAGGFGGRATDLEIEAEEILKMRARLNKVISEQTGQPIKKVEKDTERNFWMSAEAAKEYGLVGKIIASVHELKR
ncbi:MAG: ATP-dependent Clp protease proteolytic subunit [Deltaproteobacteria bacterium]|nr:ATP-dependent Clp protease proteolytic subunit [Deltaproteobacteria bacterium]